MKIHYIRAIAHTHTHDMLLLSLLTDSCDSVENLRPWNIFKISLQLLKIDDLFMK